MYGNNYYQENCGSRHEESRTREQESCCADREESSRACCEEVCCGRSLETYQGFVHEGIADHSSGRALRRGTQDGEGVAGGAGRNRARIDSQEGREGVHASWFAESCCTGRAGKEEALRQGPVFG